MGVGSARQQLTVTGWQAMEDDDQAGDKKQSSSHAVVLLMGPFLRKMAVFAGRPWRKADSWMGSLWEDHRRPKLLRCLGGDVVATSRNRGANMAGPRGQSWPGGQAVPAGLRLRTRQRLCLCVCGRETSHPLRAGEGKLEGTSCCFENGAVVAAIVVRGCASTHTRVGAASGWARVVSAHPSCEGTRMYPSTRSGTGCLWHPPLLLALFFERK